MPANRKHRAVDTASAERWALLGLQLRARRLELGYPVRKAFAKTKGLVTDKGAPNVRMINAMENNERPGSYAPGRLEQFARAYEVTAESVYALLDGKTDELEPATAASPRQFAAPGLPPPPQESQLVRDDAVRPYADPIWERLLQLRDQGVIDPDGALLGLSPFYAKVWDDSAGKMVLSDRVWLVGTVLRNAAAWNEGREQDATSA